MQLSDTLRPIGSSVRAYDHEGELLRSARGQHDAQFASSTQSLASHLTATSSLPSDLGHSVATLSHIEWLQPDGEMFVDTLFVHMRLIRTWCASVCAVARWPVV